MTMAAVSRCNEYCFAQSLCSTPRLKARVPIASLSFSPFLEPDSASKHKSFRPLRLKISYRESKASQECFRVPTISKACLGKEGQSSDFQEEASIDLKLPRRSLLVAFTCNVCGARSERLINRLAYERGLVYVQCSGCSQYHKLVDNLGLVIEYKLLDEADMSTNADQV